MEPGLERNLILRAQRGDMTAYEQLYRAHKDALYHRVIRPRTRSGADAEDVLVDTFTTALERLQQFTWTGRSIFAWFARIAINKAHDVGRRTSRDDKGKVRLLSEARAEAAPRPDEALELKASRAEAAARVEAVLADLNPRYARALRLRLLEDQTRAACAEALEVTVATFDVVLLRAVRSFRKNWAIRFGDEVR